MSRYSIAECDHDYAGGFHLLKTSEKGDRSVLMFDYKGEKTECGYIQDPKNFDLYQDFSPLEEREVEGYKKDFLRQIQFIEEDLSHVELRTNSDPNSKCYEKNGVYMYRYRDLSDRDYFIQDFELKLKEGQPSILETQYKSIFISKNDPDTIDDTKYKEWKSVSIKELNRFYEAIRILKFLAINF